MSVLIVLGVVWTIVAGTAVIKVRNEERVESVDGFQRQLRSFGGGLPPLPESPGFGTPSDNPSIGRAPAIPALQGRLSPHRSQRLRRILAALLVAAGLTLVVALVVGTRMAWGLHLLVDNVLLAYVALLVRRRDAWLPKPEPRQKARPDRPKRSDPFDENDPDSDFRLLPTDDDSRPSSDRAMAGAR